MKIPSTDRRLVVAFVVEEQNAKLEIMQYTCMFSVEPKGILFNLRKKRLGRV